MRIKLLDMELEREQMYRLVHDAYVEQGYIEPRCNGRFIHYQGMLDRIPQTDVFLAYDEEGDLVGTNSLTRQNELCLHTQFDFPAETMSEARTGKNIASSWRIVTRKDCREASGVVGALIRATVLRCQATSVDTLLCTFNPKHMCKYHISLNFEMIGYNRGTQGLHNAPSVLMRVAVKDFPQRWSRQ